MKTRIVLSLFTLSILSYSLHAQTFNWAKGIGGPENEGGAFISVDGSGNVITVGDFEGTVDFNPGSASSWLTSNGNNDIFVQKMDASGNFLWAKSIGDMAYDFATGLVLDDAGNMYISGSFEVSPDFDPGSGTYTVNSAGVADVFVLKLNPMGDLVWVKSFGGSLYDYGNFITMDQQGNIHVTGVFQGTADFNPGAGITNLTSAGGNDIFVLKLDPSGNFLWARSYGGSEDDFGYAVSVDASGNVFTTGYFYDTVDFDPGAGTSSHTVVGDADMFVQKLDASGNFLWARTFGGNYGDAASMIINDPSGNVYTGGNFVDLVDFDPGVGTFDVTSAGNRDVCIQKLDASGNFVWVRTFGGTSDDRPRSLKMDASGNLYCAGIFYSTADFDPGPNTANLTSQGFQDSYIQKLDPEGNFLWAVSFGDTYDDQLMEMHVDASNSIYSTGSYGETVDFDPGAGTFNLSAISGNDIFVQKLGQFTTGLIELGDGIQIATHPNPHNDFVNVSFGRTLNAVELMVTDLQGRVVLERYYKSISNERISLPGGTTGIYLLTVKAPNVQYVVKLMKE